MKTLISSTEGDEDIYDFQPVVSTNSALKWQIEYNEHKNAKENMKAAGKLLYFWVSTGIQIEIEDCADAKEAYDLIKI